MPSGTWRNQLFGLKMSNIVQKLARIRRARCMRLRYFVKSVASRKLAPGLWERQGAQMPSAEAASLHPGVNSLNDHSPPTQRPTPAIVSPDITTLIPISVSWRQRVRRAACSHWSYAERRSERRQVCGNRASSAREVARRRQRLAGLAEAVDEAHRVRLLAAHAAAGEDHVERAAHADEARQAHRPTVAERHAPAPAVHAERRRRAPPRACRTTARARDRRRRRALPRRRSPASRAPSALTPSGPSALGARAGCPYPSRSPSGPRPRRTCPPLSRPDQDRSDPCHTPGRASNVAPTDRASTMASAVSRSQLASASHFGNA